MERNDREKLTDRLNQAEHLCCRHVGSFAEAYPTIASLRVEVTESSNGSGGWQGRWSFTERDFRHAVNCSNKTCYGGGVEIGWMIHDMARKKEADREETKICRGYEGSPKGRTRYRSCPTTFRITAHVEYKDDEATAKQEQGT